MFKFIKGALLVAGGMVLGSYCTVDAALKSETVRKGLTNALAQKLSDSIYGKQSSTNISYVKHYKKVGPQDAISEIRFDTRADAEKVLDEMQDIINAYGIVSLADAYELAGETDIPYGYNSLGWHTVSNARVQRLRVGYRIDLPPAIKI